jgi:hypothetical protein
VSTQDVDVAGPLSGGEGSEARGEGGAPRGVAGHSPDALLAFGAGGVVLLVRKRLRTAPSSTSAPLLCTGVGLPEQRIATGAMKPQWI